MQTPPGRSGPGTPRPRQVRPRSLAEVADRVGAHPGEGAASVRVTGVSLDSRDVRPGDLYAALPGARSHGADFAGEAVRGGAVAILTDDAGAARLTGAGASTGAGPAVPVLAVSEPRRRLGPLASWIFGDPSEQLALLGVTGTNGKTTTAYLLAAGLEAADRRPGLLGTIGTRLGGDPVGAGPDPAGLGGDPGGAGPDLAAVRTTPEAPALQALLGVMVERGARAAAMEVSSHALAEYRVDGCRFAAAAFTSFGQDHLDYHKDLDSYFAAKARLFGPEFTSSAVINVDDPAGARLRAQLLAGPHGRDAAARIVAVSAQGGPAADWTAERVVLRSDGSEFVAVGPAGERLAVRLALPGTFNLSNALVALATLVTAGVDADAAVRGLAACPGVPGRLERITAGQPWTALVDYAHTPDAVAAVLAAVRPVTAGRLVVVLGCGGDRDHAKRPLMARAALAGADAAVFTSDNPRSEDPRAILEQMTAGLEPGDWQVVVDRREAVRVAAERLRAGDTLLVAGKGHETGQEIAGVIEPLDDRELLRAVAGAAR